MIELLSKNPVFKNFKQISNR